MLMLMVSKINFEDLETVLVDSNLYFNAREVLQYNVLNNHDLIERYDLKNSNIEYESTWLK